MAETITLVGIYKGVLESLIRVFPTCSIAQQFCSMICLRKRKKQGEKKHASTRGNPNPCFWFYTQILCFGVGNRHKRSSAIYLHPVGSPMKRARERTRSTFWGFGKESRPRSRFFPRFRGGPGEQFPAPKPLNKHLVTTFIHRLGHVMCLKKTLPMAPSSSWFPLTPTPKGHLSPQTKTTSNTKTKKPTPLSW